MKKTLKQAENEKIELKISNKNLSSSIIGLDREVNHFEGEINLNQLRCEEEFESMMNAISSKTVGKSKAKQRSGSLKGASLDKIFEKCFEIYQVIPQTTA